MRWHAALGARERPAEVARDAGWAIGPTLLRADSQLSGESEKWRADDLIDQKGRRVGAPVGGGWIRRVATGAAQPGAAVRGCAPLPRTAPAAACHWGTQLRPAVCAVAGPTVARVVPFRVNLPGWRWGTITQLPLVAVSRPLHSGVCETRQDAGLPVLHSEISDCGRLRTRGGQHSR